MKSFHIFWITSVIIYSIGVGAIGFHLVTIEKTLTQIHDILQEAKYENN
jgi:hypothetical protein